MKIFSTKAHGVMDYVMSVFLIALPWLAKADVLQCFSGGEPS
jgi:hypothetical protein